jgi:hypothetical protein
VLATAFFAVLMLKTPMTAGLAALFTTFNYCSVQNTRFNCFDDSQCSAVHM